MTDASNPTRLREQHPAVASVDVLVPDLNGVMRGKRVRIESLERMLDEGLRMPGSMFSMDSTGEIVEGTGIVAEEGEKDRFCRVVDGSLAPVPWSAGPEGVRRAQLLACMQEADGEPFFADPRNVLSRVVSRFEERGLTPVMAVELEFYLVDPDHPDAPPAIPQVYAYDRLDRQSDLIERIREVCDAQGIDTDTAVAESHGGHFEINLRHRADPLAATDHAVLFKRAVKAVARKRGLDASFMAKPFTEGASSGLHVHVSLADTQGDNPFADRPGEPAGPLGQAVAGLCATMPEAMALFAPTANSFRRFQPGGFIPRMATWGFNNRTVALRVPPGPPAATRIEHRVAGADANPYLVVAAVLAGILHGLDGGLVAETPIEGNGNLSDGDLLPLSWNEALTAFEGARVLPDYLGERFCAHFLRIKRIERQRFQRQVSPLERSWYLTTF